MVVTWDQDAIAILTDWLTVRGRSAEGRQEGKNPIKTFTCKMYSLQVDSQVHYTLYLCTYWSYNNYWHCFSVPELTEQNVEQSERIMPKDLDFMQIGRDWTNERSNELKSPPWAINQWEATCSQLRQRPTDRGRRCWWLMLLELFHKIHTRRPSSAGAKGGMERQSDKHRLTG